MQGDSRVPNWLAVMAASRGYRPAFVAMAVAGILHFLLYSTVGISGSGVVFLHLIALLFAAWCGYGPGWLVLFIAVFVAPFIYRANFSLQRVDPLGLVLLFVLSAMMSWVSNFRRRTESQLRQDNDALDARVRVATANLQQRVAELETLYSQLSVGLCYVDQDAAIVRTNRALAAMGGVLNPASAGASIADTFRAPLNGVIAELVRGVRESGESIVNFETEAEGHAWLLGCTPVRREGDQLLGFQVTVLDITARKRDELALRQANEDLRRANEDLSQFTYIAAHDLQEPLRNVTLFSELVQQDAHALLDPPNVEHLDFIAANARRMSQLITDVVAYSSVSSMSKPKIAAVDLNDVCQSVLGQMDAEVERTGACITTLDLPYVRGDKDQLTQVFAHLLSNAIKFRQPKLEPRITISATLEPLGDAWKITVRDNGQGFTKEYGESIFGILKRLHGREVPGSGIGLAICKAVVEGHGGRIWAESTQGEGTKVHLTLVRDSEPRERLIA